MHLIIKLRPKAFMIKYMLFDKKIHNIDNGHYSMFARLHLNTCYISIDTPIQLHATEKYIMYNTKPSLCLQFLAAITRVALGTQQHREGLYENQSN